ncbi:MAG TPA: RICIN domain-containing protein [Hymenobacter sp.]|uniref:RICIN domain-containing protein n=1 Tax=Hymenobacter sp. TaxID=1898978 RepID=UPI002ED787D4
MLLTSFASQAQFNPIPGHVYEIRNAYSGTALEVGGSDRYAVNHNFNLWPYWGGANQQWEFVRVGTTGNSYEITNRNSRQFLQIYPPSAQQVVNDRVVYPVQSTARLVWTVTELPNGRITISRNYQLPNQPNSTPFLLRTDAPGPFPNSGTTGANTVVLSPNADEYVSKLEWTVIDRSAATPGVFRIENYNSGKVLSAGEDNSVKQLTNYYLGGRNGPLANTTPMATSPSSIGARIRCLKSAVAATWPSLAVRPTFGTATDSRHSNGG